MHSQSSQATGRAGSHHDRNSSPRVDSPLGRGTLLVAGKSWSDDVKRDVQALIVGTLTLAFAALFLLASLTMVLSFWLPAWLVSLLFSAGLTALGLAVFASRQQAQRTNSVAAAHDERSPVSADQRAPFAETASRSPSQQIEEQGEEIEPDEVIEVTETFVRRSANTTNRVRAAVTH